ncbi:MAG: histidine phosphatase family protein [Prevotella sp.]|nr:histidine phosphatase family protein [Prevotella sp.]
MATTLYLVRHGETVDNARQIMQGQTQGELTEQGRAQAAEVREQMRRKQIDAVVSSDLKRSVDTATIIAGPHGLTVSQTPLLRERDWGDFTGRYIPSLKGEPFPENVESLDCLLQRAQRFLEFIMNNYEGQSVVAVGHGIINKAIQAVYHHKLMREVPRMANAEVRVLELTEDYLSS